VVRDGNAIVASTNQGLDRVLIAGHIDTVPVASNLPTQLHHFEREQVIVGRGTVDMKAGVAVMLKLAVELSNPRFDVSWIFYDNEEVDSNLNGLGRLSRNQPKLLQGKFAVLCEPTSAMVEGGCNGTMRVEVSARGKKAHSARPWMGENAIHALLPALTTLSNYQPQTIEVDGLEYRESLNAVMASAGIATNVIPDLATLMVNYRFAPSKSGAEAEAILRGRERIARMMDIWRGNTLLAIMGGDADRVLDVVNSKEFSSIETGADGTPRLVYHTDALNTFILDTLEEFHAEEQQRGVILDGTGVGAGRRTFDEAVRGLGARNKDCAPVVDSLLETGGAVEMMHQTAPRLDPAPFTADYHSLTTAIGAMIPSLAIIHGNANWELSQDRGEVAIGDGVVKQRRICTLCKQQQHC
jgi:succinyl-diaminopimelate desuccinylase